MRNFIDRIAESAQAVWLLERHLSRFSEEDFKRCYGHPRRTVEGMFAEVDALHLRGEVKLAAQTLDRLVKIALHRV